MVFNKIKEFVAPVDEDEDEGEELQLTFLKIHKW